MNRFQTSPQLARWLGICMLVLLASSLTLAQATQPQTAQPQTAQAQTQAADPRVIDPRVTPQWVAPGWTDPLFFEHEMAMVRVAHLSPNAPALDIDLAWMDAIIDPVGEETDQAQAFEEARATLSGLEYGDVTDFVAVPAGLHTVFVMDPEEDLRVFHEREIDFAAGAYYTVAAVGFVLGADEQLDARVRAEHEAGEEGFFTWLENLFTDRDPDDLSFRLEVYDDQPGNFPRAGFSHVRVIHASPGTPAIDLWAWRGDLERMAGVSPAMAPHAATTAAAETTAEDAEVAQAPSLAVTVVPADASVTVVGPQGFAQEFQGSHSLTGLAPGGYIVTATRPGFEAASEEVEVGEDEAASLELELEEMPGDEAATQRQQAVGTPADPAVPATPAAPVAPGTPVTGAPLGTPAPGAVDPAFVDPTGLNFIVAGGIDFPFASDYGEVRAFGYDLDVRLAGTDNVLHELEAAVLEPGTIYTIFVVGTTMADFPVDVIVHEDVRLVGSPLAEEDPEEEEEEEEVEEAEAADPEEENEND